MQCGRTFRPLDYAIKTQDDFNTLFVFFSQHTGAGAQGGGQDFSSPGSCLEYFRTSPFIECNGARGSCHYFANEFSYWLTSMNGRDSFSAPVPETIKGPNHRERISRCQVCIKMPTDDLGTMFKNK